MNIRSRRIKVKKALKVYHVHVTVEFTLGAGYVNVKVESMTMQKQKGSGNKKKYITIKRREAESMPQESKGINALS